MEPRILVVIYDDPRTQIEYLDGNGPYTFVDYTGPFEPEAVEEFLLRGEGFDAVAISNMDEYADLRGVVEKNFKGKKILFCTSGTDNSYMNQDGKYEIAIRLTIKPSDFDKVIEREFKDL